MTRNQWLRIRELRGPKAKQIVPKKQTKARAPLNVFSSFQKVARMLRQNTLPQERHAVLVMAAVNAVRRQDKYSKRSR